MGLDMTLIKKRKKDKFNFENTTELIYWRKANHIHKWFIDNCKKVKGQDETYKVSKEQLEELRDVCSEVLNKSIIETGQIENGQKFNPETGEWESLYTEGRYIKNTIIAELLLPRQSGFFFGSTNYDEWYIADLEYTIEKISEILENVDFKKEELYYWAWW